MCIIIHKDAGLTIKKEVYKNCWDNNPDGAGFLVRTNDNHLIYQKGFMTFDDFWYAFKDHTMREALLHFRIKTHGKTSEENTHPFWVAEGEMAFAHNGVISDVERSDNLDMSDTWHFNEKVLKPLCEKFGNEVISDPTVQRLINKYIGGSKLVFMGKRPLETWIFNKNLGHSDGGIWYSNYSYRSFKNTSQTTENRWSKRHSSTTNTGTEWDNLNSKWVPLKQGDICQLRNNIIGVGSKGDYCRILSFGGGQQVNIVLYTKEKDYEAYETYCQSYSLERVDLE